MDEMDDEEQLYQRGDDDEGLGEDEEEQMM